MRFVVFLISCDKEIQTSCIGAKEDPAPAPASFTLEADKLVVSEGIQLSKDVINIKREILSGNSWSRVHQWP